MTKKLQKIQYIIIFIIAIIFISFIYLVANKEKLIEDNIPDEKNIWVSMNPIKCLGNPWEFDWLKKNQGKYEQYPIGDTKKIDENEIEIIKKFYRDEKINIFDIKSNPIEEDICTACNCPQGYKLYILISEKDVEKMTNIGWGTLNL